MDRAVLAGLLTDASLAEEMESVLRPAGIEAIIVESPAYRFARLVGLEHYEWLSGGNLEDVEDIDAEVYIV